ncbi:uncharacterized protein LOC123003555 [Tribolium madens]|uniref:uncharacterized protein LOC123003555 n=1 Tax=Tribolium madens TaxID=41895 RepID=UPI001CF7638D|nr:uncharacterized protein LOC123003555 [Tribolium madens]
MFITLLAMLTSKTAPPVLTALKFYQSFDLNKHLHEENSFVLLLIAAVVQNNVEFFKNLELLPEFLQAIKDRDGNNLLQIAIIRQNREIFDYILSLKLVPLEHLNEDGETALSLAFSSSEYFANSLIKNGAQIALPPTIEKNESCLHFVVRKGFFKVAKFLIEKGVDVNDRNQSGVTPLYYCLDLVNNEDKIEFITTLLVYDADTSVTPNFPSYNIFERAVLFCSLEIQEILFLYMFDKYTHFHLHIEVLLEIGLKETYFFNQVYKHTDKLIVDEFSLNYYQNLFVIKVENLKLLIEKFEVEIRKLLTLSTTRIFKSCPKIAIENVSLLIESDLKWDAINFLQVLNNSYDIKTIIGCESENIALGQICFLLSYGFKLRESDLQHFYNKYGYTELLKILLHMDFECSGENQIDDILLLFLYDVTLDLETYLKDPSKYSLTNIDALLDYFAHPRLRELCYAFSDDNIFEKIDNQPKIPKLVELARNTFRRSFTQKFNIQSARLFYTFVNSLSVEEVHRKIITFETKLY